MNALRAVENKPSPLTEYQRYFPHHTPTCFQQDLIEQLVDDLATWREVLIFWAGNDYRPQSVQKMLKYYDELKAGPAKRFEPGTQELEYVEPPPCDVCGKKYCLNLHRDA